MEGTPEVKPNPVPNVVLDPARGSLISSSGALLLRGAIRVAGLDRRLSAALSPWRRRPPHLDPDPRRVRRDRTRPPVERKRLRFRIPNCRGTHHSAPAAGDASASHGTCPGTTSSMPGGTRSAPLDPSTTDPTTGPGEPADPAPGTGHAGTNGADLSRGSQSQTKHRARLDHPHERPGLMSIPLS